MRAGEVLGEAWALYKAHWRHLLPIALVVFLLFSLLSLVAAAVLGDLAPFAGGLIAVAGTFWLQGALVIAVEDIRDGRADLSIRDTLVRLRPRVNTLSLAAIVVILVGSVALVATWFGLVLLVVPGLLVIALVLFLLTRSSLVVPAIVLENRGVFDAFRRSWEIVRGRGWSVFGLILLLFVLLIAATIAIGLLLLPLPDAIQAFAGQLLSNTLTAPFVALALTVTYYRLREAGEATEAAVVPTAP